MKYEYVGKGKTREEAAKAAVDGLIAQLTKAGVKRPNDAELHEEVIALPKKKFFGLLGSSDAEVKVSYDDGKKEKSPSQKRQQSLSLKRPKRLPRKKRQSRLRKLPSVPRNQRKPF